MLAALLVFRLHHDLYALPIEGITEVMALIAVKKLPDMPADWLGVANIRGTVTPVIDLRLRLGLPAPTPDLSAPLIVVHNEKKQAAFLVDMIDHISYHNEIFNESAGAVSSEKMTSLVYNNQILIVLNWKILIAETAFSTML